MASSSDNPTAGERRLLRWWLGVCVIVAAALGGSQLAEIPVRSALRGYDNTFNYLWLRSAMVDGDWDFRNDLEECPTLDPSYRASALALPRTATNRIPNKYGIGWAVLTVPFYLIADGIVSLGRGLGFWSYANDGFNAVYQCCIHLGHVALGVFALYLAVRTVTSWMGDRFSAYAGVLLVWSASSLVYYQSVNTSMSHGAAFFAVTLMAFAISRGREQPSRVRWWLLAGTAFGLAVTVRFQLAVFGVSLAVAVMAWNQNRGLMARRVGWVSAGALPFIALQCWAWQSVYGRWLVFGYGEEGESFHWSAPAVLQSLFSPWHGLFYWHPFLFVAIVGLLRWVWTGSTISRAWWAAFVLILYINSAWWCWWFASSFGNRGYDAALLPVMAGAAWLVHTLRGRLRFLFWIAAVFFGLWNFYAVLLYRSGAISRSEPVTWFEMIRASGDLRKAVKF